MIALDLKSPDEILSMLEGYDKIVLFGDSGCAQLCDVGGLLQLEDMEEFLTKNGKQVLGHVFVEGGICDKSALHRDMKSHQTILVEADAFLVQACGVATQTITEEMPEKETFPAADSKFLGVMPKRFHHEEMCSLCGECILHLTGGICPIARCPKGILNGPCGGSMDGKCERDDNTDCVWHLIYERLEKLGKLENIRKIWEIKDWSLSQGPHKTNHEDAWIGPS